VDNRFRIENRANGRVNLCVFQCAKCHMVSSAHRVLSGVSLLSQNKSSLNYVVVV